MDWSRTKTIFILTFLILNLFLVYQLLEKQQDSKLDLINESTIEEKLAAEDITIQPAIPKMTIKKPYLNGKSKYFTPEDFKGLTDQKIVIRNEKVYSTFEKTVKMPGELSADSEQAVLQQFLKDKVLDGDSYVFWDEYEGENGKWLLFFQKYGGDTLYFNKNGMLLVQLDEQNNMLGYIQTYLEDIENMKTNDEELLTAMKAIENLYIQNELSSGSKISKMELGYYSLVPLTKDAQVLVPTWRILVGKDKEYFVNAMEGQIHQVKVGEWIQEALQ